MAFAVHSAVTILFNHRGRSVFSLCSLCLLCVLCGYCSFLPQSAQRLLLFTRGMKYLPQRAQSFLTTEGAEASSATRCFEFYTTEDTEFFLRVLCVFSVFSAVTVVFYHRGRRVFTRCSLCLLCVLCAYCSFNHRVHRVFFNPSGLFQLPEPHVFDVMGVRKHIYGLYFNQGVFFT